MSHAVDRPHSQPWGMSAKAWELVKSGVQKREPGDKLILVNETGWYTPDLRKLVRATLRAMGVSERRTVRVVHARQTGGSSGHAALHSRNCTVRVHSPSIKVWHKDEPRDAMQHLSAGNVMDLCGVLMHEIEHNLGLGHEDMVDGFGGRQFGDRRTKYLPWARNLVVRSKVAVLAERAAKRPPKLPPISLWERKLKMAQIKLRTRGVQGTR